MFLLPVTDGGPIVIFLSLFPFTVFYVCQNICQILQQSVGLMV